MPCQIHHGNCLAVLPTLADGSVDMVFADLPYGVTANKWDSVIPFEPLWKQFLRVGRPNTAFIFTATFEFAAALYNSSAKSLFRYDLVWEKTKATGFVHANHMPLRCHELLLVFSRAKANSAAKTPMFYNPQKTPGKPYNKGNAGGERRNIAGGMKGAPNRNVTGDRHPRSVLRSPAVERGQHPTQKPVELMEWLVKTYTNPGDTVLDPTMGSGTTGVACVNTGRKFVGIEKDAGFFVISEQRIANASKGQLGLQGVA